MANAMLDAGQEGDSYRRVEVITGNADGDSGEGPGRGGEL
jgi:hypothetical protein